MPDDQVSRIPMTWQVEPDTPATRSRPAMPESCQPEGFQHDAPVRSSNATTYSSQFRISANIIIAAWWL
jgi:hypothetical protein